MDRFFTELDKLAAVGSYYIAASALILTLIALFVAVFVFYQQRKTEIAKREDEIRQRRNDAVINLFRIITGITDRDHNNNSKLAHQSAAIVALRDYPEFHDALLVQKEYFDKNQNDAAAIWLKAHIDATVKYWDANSEFINRNHRIIDYELIKRQIKRYEEQSKALERDLST